MTFNVNILGLRQLEAKPRGDRLLEAALEYARSGARVVPVYANSKIPGIEDWGAHASRDPAVIRSWFGPNGKFWNANVAVLIDGFRVIDVDRHGEADGFKTLAGVLDGVPCPRAMTPNDGEHLLAISTDVKHDPTHGVEILDQGKLFTVYPSEIDGKRYLWKTGGTPIAVKRIREAATPASVPGAVALAPAGYVRGLLEDIDPDTDYGTWLRVGMAIHHNDAGPAGLKVWDEWSQQGRKYKEGEPERRWGTFDANRGKPTTLRWLIIEAIKNGRRATKEDILYHGNLFNSIEVERVNEKYGVFDLKGKLYVVYEENGDIHMADQSNFRLKIANQKIEVDGKLKPMSDVWLEHPDRRVVTDIGMWEVGKEPEGALNYYKGLAVEPVKCKEKEIKLFLDFCKDDICRGNEEYYEYLMDLLATKLQNPLRLMKICLVLRGGEGVGKGALTRVMENIIGPRHSVNVSSPDAWLGKYGSLLTNAIWLSANEAHWSGNHTHGERLKALVTEESFDLEEKYIQIRQHKNRMMVAITTNNEWGVPAGHDSRRYFVLDVSGNRANDPKFWDEFHALMGTDPDTRELNDPVYLGKILYWLKHRKVKGDMKRALETEWLQEQRRETAADSRDDMFVAWVRNTFTGDVPDDLITGPGGYSFVIVKRLDGSTHIRFDKMYEDYRTYVGRMTKKPRMVLGSDKFMDKLARLGMNAIMVRKSALTLGGRRMADTSVTTKISVMKLPSSDEVMAAINEQFPLFKMEFEESDDVD